VELSRLAAEVLQDIIFKVQMQQIISTTHQMESRFQPGIAARGGGLRGSALHVWLRCLKQQTAEGERWLTCGSRGGASTASAAGASGAAIPVSGGGTSSLVSNSSGVRLHYSTQQTTAAEAQVWRGQGGDYRHVVFAGTAWHRGTSATQRGQGARALRRGRGGDHL
jgi:hypothetical protein